MINPLDFHRPSLLRCNIQIVYLRLRLAFTLSPSMRFILGYDLAYWKYKREQAQNKNRKDGDYGQ